MRIALRHDRRFMPEQSLDLVQERIARSKRRLRDLKERVPSVYLSCRNAASNEALEVMESQIRSPVESQATSDQRGSPGPLRF